MSSHSLTRRSLDQATTASWWNVLGNLKYAACELRSDGQAGGLSHEAGRRITEVRVGFRGRRNTGAGYPAGPLAATRATSFRMLADSTARYRQQGLMVQETVHLDRCFIRNIRLLNPAYMEVDVCEVWTTGCRVAGAVSGAGLKLSPGEERLIPRSKPYGA